jgi:EmrB/QacA subfamily drug resistance transporter
MVMSATTASTGSASTESAPIVGRHVWPLAVVVVAGSIMSILDTTIVNVALQTLSVDLDAPIGTVQWVVTGYMLALAAVIPVTGWAARRIGTRRLYLMSLVLFTLGSLLCGFAWSIDSLIFFRILQGLGGGMLMPTGMIILARAAGPQQVGRVLSVIGVPMVLAPVFGPALGGLLVEHVGWRWIFFVNIPVGIVAVALAWRILPAGHGEKAGPLDWLGVALLSTGLPTLTYGLAEAGSGAGFGSPNALVPIAVGITLTALFVQHSLRSSHPLLNVRLYSNRAFAAASATTFCLGASLFGAMILLPLYFQIVRGASVVETGLLIMPQSIGAAIAMPFTGRLSDRIGGGPLALAGVLVTAFSTLPFAFVTAATPVWMIETALLVRGVGIGIAMMPAMSAAYAVLRPEQIADATPQLTVVQRVGGSIGTAVLAVVLGSSLASATDATQASDAFARAYWWATGITLAAIVPAVVLLRAERHSRRSRSAAAALATTETVLEAA